MSTVLKKEEKPELEELTTLFQEAPKEVKEQFIGKVFLSQLGADEEQEQKAQTA